MDLVLFAAWCFLVAVAGGLVGLVLGNLRLPATVLLASSPAAGAGANLAMSAAAAGTASIAHVRAGRVNWRLVGWMGPPSVAGALVGGYVSGELPGDALRVAIAVVLLHAGIDLLRRPARPPARRGPPASDGLDRRAAVIAGVGIGLLGGIVGVILGSLRMPALLRYVGETAHRAVGTNVVVGLAVGVAGALAHLPNSAPDAGLTAVGVAASVPGALLGSRLTGRLSQEQLVRAIGVVLLIAAAAMVAQVAAP